MAPLITFGEPCDTRKWVANANKIAARIADGRYPSGQWLPPLAKISAELCTENSHAPIRRALKEIHAQNLISFSQTTGYYVGNSEPEDKPHEKLKHNAARKTPKLTPGTLPDTGLVAPGQVAAAFGVHPRTVTEWARTGKLAFSLTPGGHRRYETSDVKRLLGY